MLLCREPELLTALVSPALNIATVQSNKCGHIKQFIITKKIYKGAMHAPLCQDLLCDTSIFAAPLLQLLTLSTPVCFLINVAKYYWGISHDQKGTKVWTCY